MKRILCWAIPVLTALAALTKYYYNLPISWWWVFTLYYPLAFFVIVGGIGTAVCKIGIWNCKRKLKKLMTPEQYATIREKLRKAGH